MNRRRYRMTPKRKAALRKAQLASARKRRRGRNRKLAVAGGVTVLAVTAGAAYGYRRHVQSRPKKSKELDVVRVTGLGSQVGTPVTVPDPTAGFTRINLDIGAATKKAIEKFDKDARRAAQRRESNRKRDLRLSRKRSKYWQGKTKRVKKVPKRNRFTRAAQARKRKGK